MSYPVEIARIFVCPECSKRWNKCRCTGTEFCYGCKEVINRKPNHKCDDKRENKVENARHAHDELGIERSQTEIERLEAGFTLMNMDEDASLDYPR